MSDEIKALTTVEIVNAFNFRKERILMKYTISCHNGTAYHRAHNARELNVVVKESHIDITRQHDNILDLNIVDVYEELFGKAIAEHDEKQKEKGHAERCIVSAKNYYDKIKNDKKKHVAYEMIVQIGNKDNCPCDDIAEKIYRDFCRTWNLRNYRLKPIGFYLHNDEDGGMHMHVDYVPFATECERGMSTQNSLRQALAQMGYESEGKSNTAQMQWEEAQREYLAEICSHYGIEVDRIKKNKKVHVATEEYKLIQRIADLKSEKELLKNEINNLIDYHDEIAEATTSLEVEKAREKYKNKANTRQNEEIR